jgi:hypothetical protein
VVYKTSDAGWGTFFDTEKAYAFTGVKAYTGKIDGSVLKLTEVSQANAGTPVILEGTYYNKVAKATPAEMPDNDLKGTTEEMNGAAGNIYVLNKTNKNGVGFYKLKSTGTIGANKAYLVYDGALAREFFLFDEATGIEMPTVEDNADAVVYDLQGRRVAQPTKGLYIVNGKKVIK